MVRQGLLTRVGLGLAACALTALAYLPVVDYPFVLDDRTTVLLNPSLVDLADWRGILLYDPWHPLVNVSFAFDSALSGIGAFGFHITSGILHVMVVALLFTLATPRPTRRPTGVKRGSDQGQATFAVSAGRLWAAFVAAAAFGTNPLTARSVAYVSARADLLFTLGILLAIVLARRAWRLRSRAPAIAAGIVAAIALAAAPFGAVPAHGPPRVYLPAVVIALAAAWYSPPLFARSRAARASGVLAVGALAFITQVRLAQWADPVALWRAEVARRPGAWDAHLGYADALRESSHCAEAAAAYREALRLNPDLAAARTGVARCR